MTHWKKNIDPNFIKGEDLVTGFQGLKPEMPVIVAGFDGDKESFDQTKQRKTKVSALLLTTLDGKPLFKPVVVNNKAGRFFTKETGSAEMEDWIGAKAIMYAEADKKHGHVVRFKQYVLPTLTVTHEKFAAVKKAISDDPANLAVAKQRYNISAEVEAALLAK